MRDKIIGPEVWQKYELAEIWAPVWSALGLDQLSDGGGSAPSPPLQSGAMSMAGFTIHGLTLCTLAT